MTVRSAGEREETRHANEVAGRKPNIKSIVAEKYEVTPGYDAGVVILRFKGNISAPDAEQVLASFFATVHEYAMAKAVAQVLVDLTDLAFCNSCGFKGFVRWLQALQGAKGSRYKITFRQNPKRIWQRTSLLALSCFGIADVVVE